MDERLVFGIYPGGEAGSDTGVVTGAADDGARVLAALRTLQGGERPFAVRVYERFSDADRPSPYPRTSPPGYETYAGEGRKLDVVAMFQSRSGDVEGFLGFVRELARRHGSRLCSLQVTEEASFRSGPDAIDGPYPRVLPALVEGVCAGREALDAAGAADVPVGFSVTPTFGEAAAFWPELGRTGGAAFRRALGYVALDFFPDVFAPAAPDGQPGDVHDATRGLLRALRREWLPTAGLRGDLPIHVGEHGWPTGPGRSYERQAQVLERVVHAVHAVRGECGVRRYTAFALRDADSDSSGEDAFWRQFGLLRDDYTPKPAFEAYRALIAELG